MHISQYFLRGDVRGAIAHMRAHEEFRDVLPAYLAIFENCEYRTYGIPAPLNDILRLYQIYFRDTFYCGLPEAEAADKLLARLKKRLDLPDADEARLTERLQRFIVAELRLQLVAEGVVFAGLVVDLLQDILRGPIRHKIGISALSLSQEPEHGIFRAVYGPCVRHGSGACPA